MPSSPSRWRFFSADQKEDRQRANNPWAVQAAEPAASEPSVIDNAVDAGVAYLDEAGVPIGEAGETAERLDNTAAAMAGANNHN
ncbi:MAG: hypothetical protein ABIT10_06470 [Alteraurantiacibacter sp.]